MTFLDDLLSVAPNQRLHHIVIVLFVLEEVLNLAGQVPKRFAGAAMAVMVSLA